MPYMYETINDLRRSVNDAKLATSELETTVNGINQIADMGLISLRQQRYLLLSAADQAVNRVRDAHDAIQKATAEWEHLHGDPAFAAFDNIPDDTFTLTGKHVQVAD